MNMGFVLFVPVSSSSIGNISKPNTVSHPRSRPLFTSGRHEKTIKS